MRRQRALAALRDTLLPKLISGELRVKDAEKFIGRAVLMADAPRVSLRHARRPRCDRGGPGAHRGAGAGASSRRWSRTPASRSTSPRR